MITGGTEFNFIKTVIQGYKHWFITGRGTSLQTITEIILRALEETKTSLVLFQDYIMSSSSSVTVPSG